MTGAYLAWAVLMGVTAIFLIHDASEMAIHAVIAAVIVMAMINLHRDRGR